DGDESEMERLKAIATAAGVRDRVDFLGSVAHHELPYFYSAADVCVMPSYSESFGLVGLEAQACGRPVVGSGVTGLRSVVRDDVSGYLIDSHDPATYAERIGRLLDNPELAQQMGRRGRLLAQRLSSTPTALCSALVGVATVAEKTRCVESASQAGRPMSPVVSVAVVEGPVRLRTRRLAPFGS